MSITVMTPPIICTKSVEYPILVRNDHKQPIRIRIFRAKLITAKETSVRILNNSSEDSTPNISREVSTKEPIENETNNTFIQEFKNMLVDQLGDVETANNALEELEARYTKEHKLPHKIKRAIKRFCRSFLHFSGK